VSLGGAQQSLVREMATSGRAVQLALAPAGTGKTTALAVLTRAWQDSGGTVLGLAPSAVAAEELGACLNSHLHGGITTHSDKPTEEGTTEQSTPGSRGRTGGPWRPPGELGRQAVR